MGSAFFYNTLLIDLIPSIQSYSDIELAASPYFFFWSMKRTLASFSKSLHSVTNRNFLSLTIPILNLTRLPINEHVVCLRGLVLRDVPVFSVHDFSLRCNLQSVAALTLAIWYSTFHLKKLFALSINIFTNTLWLEPRQFIRKSLLSMKSNNYSIRYSLFTDFTSHILGIPSFRDWFV